MSYKRFLVLAVCLAAASCTSGSESLANTSAEECRSLGFTAAALCSDCERFEAVVHDAGLVADCRRCCVDAAKEGNSVFDKATLEICPWHLQGLPAVKDFIERHADAFGDRLAVRTIPGRPPTLKLRSKDGVDREDVRVDAWKTEHLVEFLGKKLKEVSASGALPAAAQDKKGSGKKTGASAAGATGAAAKASKK